MSISPSVARPSGLPVTALGCLVLFVGLQVQACADPAGPSRVPSGAQGLLKATVDSLTPPVAPSDPPSEWNRRQPQVILVPKGDGAVLAWNDRNKSVRITTLGAGMQSQGQDRILDSTVLGGFVVTNTGYGLVAVQDPRLYVAALPEAAGPEAFRTLLIGDKPRSQKGSKFDPMDFGSSRLAFANGRYCAYYSHQQNFADTGEDVHQGDMLVQLNDQGSRQSGGWDWGTSHSLDQRLIHDGQYFVTVSLGDCYPKGITFQRVGAGDKKVLMEVPGNCLGKADALLGGLVQMGKLYAVPFATPQGRSAQDAGILFADAAGKLSRTTWLTALASGDDKKVVKVNSARLADNLLVAYVVNDAGDRKDSTFAVVVDTAGKILLGPDYLAEGFHPGDDFAVFPNGDVGWAYVRGGKIRVVRISKPQVTALAERKGGKAGGRPAGPFPGGAAIKAGHDLLGRILSDLGGI